MSGDVGRYLRGQAAAAGLMVANLGLWGLIIVDVQRQSRIPITHLVLATLTSTVTAAIVFLLWRNRPITAALAAPALRQMLATHQAGHIVATHAADPSRLRTVALVGNCKLHKPTVTPVTERALQAEMMIALGGVAADELFAGESGIHAADDLRRATAIAVDMTGRYGMTGSPVSLAPANRGKRGFARRVFDDARTRKDLEALLRATKQDTVKIMLEKRHVLVALRDALLRHNRLSPGEIRAIVVGADRRRRDDDRVLVDLRVVSNRPTAEAGP